MENHNVPNIGKLTNNLSVEAQILKISKNLISVMAVRNFRYLSKLLKGHRNHISNTINVTIEDSAEIILII